MAEAVRPPAVAGSFYPTDAVELAATVSALLEPCGALPTSPSAVLSPHAGYRYSGALTARALATTRDMQPDIIVVLSPSHRHAFEGVAVPSASAFALPGGAVPVETEMVAQLADKGLVQTCDAAHDREHGIEVQLPFLRHLHPQVPIVPLVLGQGGTELASQIIDLVVRQSDRPLFVLSSDLSHFLSDAEARSRDAATAARLEEGKSDLTAQDACGAAAINAFLTSHHGTGTRALRLQMANSARVTGDENRTVGYGAWAFAAPEAEVLSDKLRKDLLRTARQALASRLTRGSAPHIEVSSFAAPLQTRAASFVTLEQDNRLRGCVGSLLPHRALVEDVAINVQKAALNDPRFHPLSKPDLERTRIKIAVLSPRRPMVFHDQIDVEVQLKPGRDGLILRDRKHTGTFLPMVWDKLPEPHAFVQALKVKAGLPSDHWSDSLQIDLFHAESFGEDR